MPWRGPPSNDNMNNLVVFKEIKDEKSLLYIWFRPASEQEASDYGVHLMPHLLLEEDQHWKLLNER